MALARGQQRGELGAHARLLRGQCLYQVREVRVAQADGDAQAVQRIARQGMRLRVAQHLQAVFQAAQEQIGLPQGGAILGRDLPGIHQCGQREQQPALAQGRLAAGADQLQRLAEKLDFTDAPGTALDVLVHVTAGDFGGDRRLHVTQAVQRGEIQIAAVDERPQRGQPGLAGRDVTGHRARLEPGITLPVAAFALEVLVHARERQRDPAGATERPQAQVYAMAEAIGGGVIEQLGQPLAEAREILLGRQGTRTIGLAALGIGVDQIDIRAEVELPAAQLAQPEHHQPLHVAVLAAHLPVPRGELLLQGLQRQTQAVLGQRSGAGQCLLHAVQPRKVAPDQAGGHRRAVTAQQPGPFGRLAGVEHGQRQRRTAGLLQVRQQRRLAAQRIQREIAHRGELAQERQLPGCGGFTQRRGEARQRAVDERDERVGERRGVRGHAPIVGA